MPALGDVQPWKLAVVLDMNGNDARIGLQPKKDPDGRVNRDRETGTMVQTGLHWTKGNARNGLTPGRRRLCGTDRREAGRLSPTADPRGRRRHRRDGPLYGPRLRDGRRLLVRPVGVQPRDAGDAPARLFVQADRLRTALDNGYTPSSIVLDAPISIDQGAGLGVWTPENFEGKSGGPHTLRYGVEHSINQMTVRLARDVGMPLIAEYAKRFGIYDDLPPYLSMSLGSGETTLMRMTTAYSMLANGGKKIKSTLIDRIQDRWGHTIYRHDERTCQGCDEAKWQPGEDEPKLVDKRDQVPRSADRLPDHLDHGRRDPARHRHQHQGGRQASRRQDRHDQRGEGPVVRRLLARSRGRRVHGLRPSPVAGRFGAGRALHRADLPRLHDDGAEEQAGHPVPRAAGHQADLGRRQDRPALEAARGSILEAFKPGTAPPESYAGGEAAPRKLDAGARCRPGRGLRDGRLVLAGVTGLAMPTIFRFAIYPNDHWPAQAHVIAAGLRSGLVTIAMARGSSFGWTRDWTSRFRSDLPRGLKDADEDDLRDIEISPTGLDLHWPRLDADLYVPGLLAGRTGSLAWMAENPSDGIKDRKRKVAGIRG